MEHEAGETVVRVASSAREIERCHAVMEELRPHVSAGEFLERVLRQQREGGYRLAYLQADGEVKAVAGYRVSECLAWGRFLYVDDLVTRGADRSRGYGRRLIAFLRERAAEAGCTELHLDSRTHRTDAHRFYLREGMENVGFHFAVTSGHRKDGM